MDHVPRESMGSHPVILFQPQNHVGLGHLNRSAAIALALRQIDPGLRTPFVVEGAAHSLLDALNLPYAALPSSHRMYETDCWSSWDTGEKWGLSLAVSRAIVASLKPHLVVFDVVPNRAFASVVREAGLPVVLCLREVNDLDRYLERLADILPHVRRILIPHDEGAFQLPGELRDRSFFVGEIVRPSSIAAMASHDPNCSTIMIHAGGGGYPGTVNFFNAAIEALTLLRQKHPNLKARLITGPLFSEWQDLKLAPDLSVVPFDPDLTTTLAGADLVLCQAGYNTIAELKGIATRALLVPAERRWDNQFARAQQSAKASQHFRVFQGGGPNDLARAAEEFLCKQIPQLTVRSADGARKAAERICELLRGTAPRKSTSERFVD